MYLAEPSVLAMPQVVASPPGCITAVQLLDMAVQLVEQIRGLAAADIVPSSIFHNPESVLLALDRPGRNDSTTTTSPTVYLRYSRRWGGVGQRDAVFYRRRQTDGLSLLEIPAESLDWALSFRRLGEALLVLLFDRSGNAQPEFRRVRRPITNSGLC